MPPTSAHPSPADYTTFLATKRLLVPAVGNVLDPESLPAVLFPFQRDIVRWALAKGRSAIFADTGLGKSLMQLAWAQQVVEWLAETPDDGPPVALIFAPLAVAQQTAAEGERWGIPVQYARDASELPARGIAITNYERAERFDPAQCGAVVLDESSILKGLDGQTRRLLTQQWARTRWRLCCTATPAPNDIAELANHAEFLGILTRAEMLATFFVHDADQWRLKGHGRQAFYRWLASWSMSLRRPSDLGYSDDGYILPPLEIVPEIVASAWHPPGQLFPTVLRGIQERAELRQATIADRIVRVVALVQAEPAESWLLWCGLNAESDALAAALPHALVVQGADPPDVKTERLLRFARGDARILITKPRIAGFGLNLQVCARQAFVGIGDSYETYYQAIRRSWRFGQTRPVRAHVVVSEPEEPIYQNVLRKEREAQAMQTALIACVTDYERLELAGNNARADYDATYVMEVPSWLKSKSRC